MKEPNEIEPRRVKFDLESVDGNAYNILGGWRRAARKQGWEDEEIDMVTNLAKSGNYDHLLQTIMRYSE